MWSPMPIRCDQYPGPQRMTSELEEEQPSARRKPVVVKLRQAKSDDPRLEGCPAYPTTGLLAGATVEWCREARGKMAACDKCQWRES